MVRSCNIRNPRFAQHIEQRHLGLDPNRVCGTPQFSGTRLVVPEAHVEVHGSVDSFNHFAHRCLAAGCRYLKASGWSSPGCNQAGARQTLQDLGEKAVRNSACRGEDGQRQTRSARRFCQMNHNPDGVIGRARELHRRMASFHRTPRDIEGLAGARGGRAQEDRNAECSGRASPVYVSAVTDPQSPPAIIFVFQMSIGEKQSKLFRDCCASHGHPRCAPA
jgi:hypothetical protein